MRAHEILNENTAEQLLGTMNDIIATKSAEGAETVSIPELVMSLRNMGFNATEEGILAIAPDSPFVFSVNGSELSVGERPDLVDAGENSDDQVDQMASSAVDIG